MTTPFTKGGGFINDFDSVGLGTAQAWSAVRLRERERIRVLLSNPGLAKH